MRNLLFILCCLFSFNTYGQKSFSDSLHTHNHINYNLESHRNSTTFKYVGRAISILGAFSSFQNIQNGADQDKLNTSAAIIAACGLIGLLADISQDVEEVKLGEIVKNHLTENKNKLSILHNNESNSDSLEHQVKVNIGGPLNFDLNREIIYTDKNVNEYIVLNLSHRPGSNAYDIEFEKGGRRKTISIYENRHHRLSQE